LAWTADFEPRALAELKKLDRNAQKRIVSFSENVFQERLIRASTGSLSQAIKEVYGDTESGSTA